MHVHTLTCTYKLQNCIYENWVDFKKNVHFFMEIYIFIYKNINLYYSYMSYKYLYQ